MNILIVWGYDQPKNGIRNSIIDYIYSFKKYDKHNRYYYLNMPFYSSRWDYSWIEDGMFDVILFTCTFLGIRWHKEYWRGMWDTCEKVFGQLSCRKVILPQDDYDNTAKLWDFIRRINIGEIYTVIPKQDHGIVYPKEQIGECKIKEILTGYVEESYLDRTFPTKSIDVIYRANKLSYKFGKLGQQKTEIIDHFQPKLKGLTTDICNTIDRKNLYIGESWIEHLAMARCTLGTPSGSSVIDINGDIGRKYEEYMKTHTTSSYDEAKAACFPELKENLHGTISPRHFEASITRTCQILIKSDYAGILKADIDYIPVEEDYSDIDEVISKIRDEDYCREIAENCYNNIVGSERYTYHTLIDKVIGEYDSNLKAENNRADLIIERKCELHNRKTDAYNLLIHSYATIKDGISLAKHLI